MTREADILSGRRDEESPAREELRRRLLALVLAAVLVWYTVIVPSGAPARSYAARTPDDEGRDGEVRGGEMRGREGFARADSRAYSIAGVKEEFAFGPPAVEDEREPVEDLDWPEYIYPD
jgi:hypothetical protein